MLKVDDVPNRFDALSKGEMYALSPLSVLAGTAANFELADQLCSKPISSADLVFA